METKTEFWLCMGRLVTAGIGFSAFYIAFTFTKTSEVLIIHSLNPMIAAIIAYLFLKERVAMLESVLFITAFCGVVILALSKNEATDEIFPNKIVGIFLAFLGGLMAGITYNIIRKMNMTLHMIYSPFYNAISGVFVVIIFYQSLNLGELGL